MNEFNLLRRLKIVNQTEENDSNGNQKLNKQKKVAFEYSKTDGKDDENTKEPEALDLK